MHPGCKATTALAHPAPPPPLTPGQVFREDGLLSYSDAAGYGLDWFEGAIARPDAVLTDVVRAANPSLAQVHPWRLPPQLQRGAAQLPSRLTTLACFCSRTSPRLPAPLLDPPTPHPTH